MIPFLWSFSASIDEGLPSHIIAGSLYPISFLITPDVAGVHQLELVVDYADKEINQTQVQYENQTCPEISAGTHRCEMSLSGYSRRTLNFSFMPGIVVSNYSVHANFYPPAPPTPAPAPVYRPSTGSSGGSFAPRPYYPPTPPIVKNETVEQNTTEVPKPPIQNVTNITIPKPPQANVTNITKPKPSIPPAETIKPTEKAEEEFVLSPNWFEFASVVFALCILTLGVAIYVWKIYMDKPKDLPSERMKKIIEDISKDKRDDNGRSD